MQLEKYQESSRKTNPSHTSLVPHQRLTSEPGYRSTEAEIFTETHRDHSHVPVSWGKVNSHTLAPLLNAYEETITEKNEILENYEMEFARFTTALKEITKENEVLHKRLTEDERCSTKLSEELEKVRSELKGAKEQNDVLIKKCALKQDKVEEILKCYEKKGNHSSSSKRKFPCNVCCVKLSSCNETTKLCTRSTVKADQKLLL